MKTLITTLALALVVASATVNAAPRDSDTMNGPVSAQETYKFDKHGNNGW